NRLPNTGLLVLNNGTLYVKENVANATTEQAGALVLAANTSDSVRVDWRGAAGSFISFTGGGTGAGRPSAPNRMEGATLNLYTNDNFVAGQNEIRFSTSPTFGILLGTPTFGSTSQAIIPWASVTTFVGNQGSESTDLVTDLSVAGFDAN